MSRDGFSHIHQEKTIREFGRHGRELNVKSAKASSEYQGSSDFKAGNVLNGKRRGDSPWEWATWGEEEQRERNNKGAWIELQFGSKQTVSLLKYAGRDTAAVVGGCLENFKQVRLTYSDSMPDEVLVLKNTTTLEEYELKPVITSFVRITSITNWVGEDVCQNRGAQEIQFWGPQSALAPNPECRKLLENAAAASDKHYQAYG